MSITFWNYLIFQMEAAEVIARNQQDWLHEPAFCPSQGCAAPGSVGSQITALSLYM
jgi:hypothetical protein